MTVTALGYGGIALALLLRVALLWQAPWYGFDRFQHIGLARPAQITWITGAVAGRYHLDRQRGAPTDYPPLATFLLSLVPSWRGRLWVSRWGGALCHGVFAIFAVALGAPTPLVGLALLQPMMIEEGLGFGARPLASVAMLPFAAVATSTGGWGPRFVTVLGCVLVVMYLHRFTLQALLVGGLGLTIGGQPEVAAAAVLGVVLGLVLPVGGYGLILSEQRHYWRVLDARMRGGRASVVGLPAAAPVTRWAARELARGVYLLPAGLVLGWWAGGEGPWVVSATVFCFAAVAVLPGLRRYGEAARYLQVPLLIGLFAPLSGVVFGVAAGTTLVALARWLPAQRSRIRQVDAATRDLAAVVSQLVTTDRVVGTWPVGECLPLFSLVDSAVYTHISYRLADAAAELGTMPLADFAAAAARDDVDILFVRGATSTPPGWSRVAAGGLWTAWENGGGGESPPT